MRFFLGSHMVGQDWWDAEIPFFVSRRRLLKPVRTFRDPRPEDYEALVHGASEERELRKTLPRARAEWALDSGGFTELSLFGAWSTSEDQFVADVLRIRDEVGYLAWTAPQDWMCEPFMLEKTGLPLEEHQARTVASVLSLRQRLGGLVIPVLQGWELDDYRRCWAMYERAGVDLEAEPVVGLGSVCRRQNTSAAGVIVRGLQPLKLHGFGVKLTGLESFGDALYSADSMAWSYRARLDHPLKGCTHKSCSNCLRYALRWYREFLQRQGQMRFELDPQEVVECVA